MNNNHIRLIVVVLTIHVVFAEWLLFEMLRLPRHPPEDLRTLLGHHRYGVRACMNLLALGWLTFVLCLAVSVPSRFNRRDYFHFAVLVCVLLAGFNLLARSPWWPVAPFDGLFD